MQKRYRIEVFSLLEFISALHLGSGKEDDRFSDQPILRNSQGIPFIPGSTLAGTFGDRLTLDQRKEWMGSIPEQVKEKKENPEVSSLIMDDAFPLPEQESALQWPVENRFQVALNRETLSAITDCHFNMEVLPVGTVFCFSCRCDLESTGEFLNAMKKFLAAGGAIGGKQNAGHGQWRCKDWAYTKFDMSVSDDLKKWFNSLHGYQWDGSWEKLKKDFDIEKRELPARSGNTQWKIKLKIEIKDGLHLSAGASGLPEKGKSDLYQAKRQKMDNKGNLDDISEYIDYGTTIKGRFRTAMEMVLRTCLIRFGGKAPEKAKELVPVDPSEMNTSPSNNLQSFFGHTKKKGQWQVKESVWQGADTSTEDHICLDEFTQQVLSHAKFDFSPLNCGKTEVTAILQKDAPDWQKNLLFSACKLLTLGIIPWGGHASRGYLGAKIEIDNESRIVSDFSRTALKEWIIKGGI